MSNRSSRNGSRKSTSSTVPARSHRFSPEEHAHALSLIVAGMKRDEVSTSVGCTTESLRRWYNEAKRKGVLPAAHGKGIQGNGNGVAAKTGPVEFEGPPPASSAPRDPGAGLGEHETKAILDYKRALSFTDDLEQADIFLKKRPFESLRIKFGITPGTLNQTRWEIIAKTVTESQTPAADLIGVCATGAETLKASTSTVKAGMPATQIRRRIYTWWLVLTHGMLVTDAFDSSVR